MPSDTLDSALPLPLTPFELMMLVEDRPEYPMVAVVDLELSGPIDRKKFEQAFQLALARHPLLSARVEMKNNRPVGWVPAEPPQIEWEETNTASPVGLPLDLSQTVGLRLKMIRNGQQTRQIVELHHACCDGTAIFQFLQEGYVHYANLTTGSKNPIILNELSPQNLSERNHFASDASSPWQRLSRFGFGMREAIKFSLRKISLLRSEQANLEAPTLQNHITFHGNGTLLACLRKAAATNSTTLNDLLLRDLLLTIAQWNASHENQKNDHLYRLVVPCDLRTPIHATLPACNIMGYAFITRQSHDCNRSPATLQGIRDEMRFIREKNASLYFIRGLEFCQRFLGGIRSLAKPNHCFATALVSNIGNPKQSFFAQLPNSNGKVTIGGLTLESVVAFPPLRQNTRIGIVLNTYANRLAIGLHYDAKSMSPAEGQQFQDNFLQNLEATASESN